MPSRPDIDWELIEKEYRIGQLSMNELARRHGTAVSTISRHAISHGWQRDLSEEVSRRTKTAMVISTAEVLAQGRKKRQEERDRLKKADEIIKADEYRVKHPPPPPPPSDGACIEAAVQTNVQVLREHLKSLREGRGMVERLMSELLATTTNAGELDTLIKRAHGNDRNPRELKALQRATSLVSRAGVLRDMANATVKYIDAERKALNIDTVREDTDDFSKFYLEVKSRSGQRLSDVIKKRTEEKNG